MREHSGVDGMHGRRLGDLLECGPGRNASPLSSHSSSLTGESAPASEPKRLPGLHQGIPLAGCEIEKLDGCLTGCAVEKQKIKTPIRDRKVQRVTQILYHAFLVTCRSSKRLTSGCLRPTDSDDEDHPSAIWTRFEIVKKDAHRRYARQEYSCPGQCECPTSMAQLVNTKPIMRNRVKSTIHGTRGSVGR